MFATCCRNEMADRSLLFALFRHTEGFPFLRFPIPPRYAAHSPKGP